MKRRQSWYRCFGKRAFDVVVSVVLLVALLPLLVTVGVIILIVQGRPVFYLQDRPGKRGDLFRVIKFRTMTTSKDAAGNLLEDGDRLTSLGKLLRSLSVDELPELYNVLKGEMSLVGPRPLLVEYLDVYSSFQARRHNVVPGITGWAQVNGRNNLGWEKRFELDVWYVEHYRFLLDMKILWLTFLKIIARSDINQTGSATMEKFRG